MTEQVSFVGKIAIPEDGGKLSYYGLYKVTYREPNGCFRVSYTLRPLKDDVEGDDLFEIAKEQGFTGSEEEFVRKINYETLSPEDMDKLLS